MSVKIKYTIYCIIALSVLLLAEMHFYSVNQEKADQENDTKDLISITKQMQEMYGPGKYGPYEELSKQINNSFLNVFYSFAMSFHSGSLPVITPHIRPEIAKNIPVIEKLAEDLDGILKNGNCMLAPDEIYSATQLKDPSADNSYKINRNLTQLAFDRWLQGKNEDSLKLMSTLFQFEKSLKKIGIYNSNENTRLKNANLDFFDTLIWFNPKENLLVKDFLSQLKPDTDTDAKLDLVNNFITSTFQYSANPFSYNLLRIAFIKNWQENNTTKTLKKYGIIPSRHFSDFSAMNYINKWTSRPALAKRINALPDTFWEENLQQCPFKADSISKICLLSYILENNKATDQSGDRYQEYLQKRETAYIERTRFLQSTYWSRTFRDQNKRWPSREEFSQENSGNKGLVLVKNDDSALFTRKLLSLLFRRDDIQRDYNIMNNKIDDYQGDDNKPTSFQCYIQSASNTLVIAPRYNEYKNFPKNIGVALSMMFTLFPEKMLNSIYVRIKSDHAHDITQKVEERSLNVSIAPSDYFNWMNDIYETLPFARKERIAANKAWLEAFRNPVDTMDNSADPDSIHKTINSGFSFEFTLPSRFYWIMKNEFLTEYQSMYDDIGYKAIFKNEREKERSSNDGQFIGIINPLDNTKIEKEFIEQVHLAGWE